MKWVYLASAPDQLTAEMWRGLLLDAEIAAIIRAGDTTTFLGVSPFPCRLMVREDDVARARGVLEEFLGEEVS